MIRFTILVCLISMIQASFGADYLTPELRREVEALKRSVREAPTDRQTAVARAVVMWRWINAYSLTGKDVPVNGTLTVSSILAYQDRPGNRFRSLDPLIEDMTLRDEQPDALGELTADEGPFTARDYITLRQTYTVGAKAIIEGGGIVVAKHMMGNHGAWQTRNPAADNYLSIRSSNPDVRFEADVIPMSGMHGGFRSARDTLIFRVRQSPLVPEDTVTITYGDTSEGSRGMLMADFSSDRMPFPLYVDFDGSNQVHELPIQPVKVRGTTLAGIHGFAPSVVAAGEAFDIAVRAEDQYYNRALPPYPEWHVYLNGQRHSTLPAGTQTIHVMEGLRINEPGVYRFTFESADGTIQGQANPILVEKEPTTRIYWGDTHGHSGFAEGVGTPERFMRWAKEDARLDYVTHSEHDIWLDDYEWEVLKNKVEAYNVEHEFIAFLGYEWTVQNYQGGHHNVLFRTAAERDRVPMVHFPTLSALYQGLRTGHDARDVVVIPHAHQAGDYRLNDPLLEPLIEIMSQHGTFEWFGRMYLNHGHEVGFTAASDNHLSQPGYTAPKDGSLSQRGGLGALLAREKTTDALFDAMKSLNTYATTGDRIILDFSVNGTSMGSRGGFSKPRKIKGRVIGTQPIDSIVLVKNDSEIWRRNYSSAEAGEPVTEGEFILTFYSDCDPIHPGDNPRGWRPWRGTLKIDGADLVHAKPMDHHNHATQRFEVKADSSIEFWTHTRGDTSSIRLSLAGIKSDGEIKLALTGGREFGGAPPIYRQPKTLPKNDVTLSIPAPGKNPQLKELPFGRYTDTITLRRIRENGEREVEFEIEDEGTVHGDYYFLRVTQVNDAVAWSSPVWIGGYRKR